MQVTDRNIGANPTGFDMRTEINNIIAALESDNSGPSEPLNTVAYMKWLDTSNATYYYYKERNHDNTAWVTLFRYTVATKIMEAVSNGVVLNDAVVHKTGDETIAGIKSFSDGVKVQNQNVSPFSGFKNYIINGNFDMWQYGTSQTSYGYGSDDRWYNANVGSTKTHSRVACTDTERALFNASYFSRSVVSSVTGTANFTTKSQKIENITLLSGKTITVSFWAKADSNKNIWLEFRQIFGTGGSPSSSVNGIYGQSIALTNTWQKKSITLTLPSISGKTLGTDGVSTSFIDLQFWFEGGSDYISRMPTIIQQSGTFDIAKVQLEEGSVATPFENRPIGLELSLCQRYYEISQVNVAAYGTAGMQWQQNIPLKVVKRVTPTVVVITPTGQPNIGTITSSGSNVNGVITTGNVVNTGSFSVGTGFTASAEL